MSGHVTVIGIDAGGSRTRFACDADGTVHTVEAGPANFLAQGRRAFARIMREGLAALDARVPGVSRSCACVCLGGAGLGRPPERAVAARLLKRLVPGARIHVTDDATLGLWAVWGARSGVVALAGTGAICLARGADGRVVRTGGWGALLGDPGSGCAIGRRALAHLRAVHDGLARSTPAAAALAAALEVDDPIAALGRFARGGAPALAALAPMVLAAAARGHRIARSIIKREGAALARFAAAAAWRAAPPLPAVALAGGLMRSRLYARVVKEHVKRSFPAVRVFVTAKEPMAGALALARSVAADDAR